MYWYQRKAAIEKVPQAHRNYSSFIINYSFYYDSVAMDLEPALAIQAYGLGQELPLRVLKDAARQALGCVVRENVNGLLGDYRADVAVDIREKRGRAGHAAAAFECGALGSIVAVDKRRDERGVHSDYALAKLR